MVPLRILESVYVRAVPNAEFNFSCSRFGWWHCDIRCARQRLACLASGISMAGRTVFGRCFENALRPYFRKETRDAVLGKERETYRTGVQVGRDLGAFSGSGNPDARDAITFFHALTDCAS